MKRLIKKSEHDFDTRDLAIVCINGKFYEDTTHALCIQQYLRQNKMSWIGILDGDNPDFNRPESSDVGMNDKIAIAHLVEDDNAVYIEKWSLHNYTIDEVVPLFKANYWEYEVYDDDSYNEETDSYTRIAKSFPNQ